MKWHSVAIAIAERMKETREEKVDKDDRACTSHHFSLFIWLSDYRFITMVIVI